MMNPNVAGIDVALEEMWVCVPEDRAEQNIRRFGAFTCDLYAIADWLKEYEVTNVLPGLTQPLTIDLPFQIDHPMNQHLRILVHCPVSF